ncbi:uncharacterized protein BX663DRAFT_520696 [Cokeromyces recurvatus]|uniref:uncharacterized protein n=1 Tax=Cokeromyces recurvatus TaxID=90255 RepID=UPI00221F24FD|nr:uncharacterized protein BX663DRAFT_520696 [Cokeromyces recurvatus]KAI7899609.1 hypothetical protein BX663DRAFT_520696 [Cokeromyces recurvatus]
MTSSKNLDALWKDITSWQTEINSKDEKLIRKKLIHDQTLPPVRKSTEINVDESKPVGLDKLKKTEPILATNTIKPQTRVEKAEAEKIKGNEYFGKKDYKNAILHYGKAIDLDPTVSVYFVNRAMAYLKINNYLEAEKDCIRGIKLQPNNVKAYWRRGIALKGLGRIDEARKDFEMGLKLEPNNKSILDELKKLPIPKTVEKSQIKKNNNKEEEKRRLHINIIDDYYTKPKEEAKRNVEIQPIKKEKEITLTVKPSKTPLKFSIPHTNFEFERDWKTYKVKGDDILYQYFQIIPPTSYASIFKSSLESDQFEKIIDLLETKYAKEKEPDVIFNVLKGLSQVKRIDMLVMFLDKKHQQALQHLFNLLKDSKELKATENDFIKLSKFYNTRVC